MSKKYFNKVIDVLISVILSVSPLAPSSSHAQSVASLPEPGAMVHLSDPFMPAIVRGINVYHDNPLKFDFILDRGNSEFSKEGLKEESSKFIKYFLASLTIPEDQMWVNLSPYEQERIIPDSLGQTEMGGDLLALDYMLKQLTASLMYPENEIGEAFWNRVYLKAKEKFGTTDIPMNTFNKVWIVPKKATMYEHQGGAFIMESHLEVMLEEDYLALEVNRNSTNHGLGEFKQEDMEIISGVSSEVVREILIPEIEREVNEGKIFSGLRQIYHSMLLASWYKETLKTSLLGSVYADQNKIEGIELKERNVKEKIYDQYVEAFKKGVFDLIKNDQDPLTKELIPRKYFSGGLQLKSKTDPALVSSGDIAANAQLAAMFFQGLPPADGGALELLTFNLQSSDGALVASLEEPDEGQNIFDLSAFSQELFDWESAGLEANDFTLGLPNMRAKAAHNQPLPMITSFSAKKMKPLLVKSSPASAVNFAMISKEDLKISGFQRTEDLPQMRQDDLGSYFVFAPLKNKETVKFYFNGRLFRGQEELVYDQSHEMSSLMNRIDARVQAASEMKSFAEGIPILEFWKIAKQKFSLARQYGFSNPADIPHLIEQGEFHGFLVGEEQPTKVKISSGVMIPIPTDRFGVVQKNLLPLIFKGQKIDFENLIEDLSRNGYIGTYNRLSQRFWDEVSNNNEMTLDHSYSLSVNEIKKRLLLLEARNILVVYTQDGKVVKRMVSTLKSQVQDPSVDSKQSSNFGPQEDDGLTDRVRENQMKQIWQVAKHAMLRAMNVAPELALVWDQILSNVKDEEPHVIGGQVMGQQIFQFKNLNDAFSKAIVPIGVQSISQGQNLVIIVQTPEEFLKQGSKRLVTFDPPPALSQAVRDDPEGFNAYKQEYLLGEIGQKLNALGTVNPYAKYHVILESSPILMMYILIHEPVDVEGEKRMMYYPNINLGRAIDFNRIISNHTEARVAGELIAGALAYFNTQGEKVSHDEDDFRSSVVARVDKWSRSFEIFTRGSDGSDQRILSADHALGYSQKVNRYFYVNPSVPIQLLGENVVSVSLNGETYEVSKKEVRPGEYSYTAEKEKDQAMPIDANAGAKGGIDLNADIGDINVENQGSFLRSTPSVGNILQSLKVSGFTYVITNMMPIVDLLPILGIH